MNETCNYTVYKHTTPSGKVYIGITCRNVKKRWGNGRGYTYSHNHHFERAIAKYGWDKILHEILFTGLSKEDAERKEIELIAKYDSTNQEHGYNIREGGSVGSRLSEETKRKLSAMRKGEKNPMYGNHSPHPWQKGNNRGIVGDRHPMYGRLGENNPRYGTKHTEESIRKMRENSSLKKSVLCVETGVVYESQSEASRLTGIKETNISAVCRKKPHCITAGGYHWEYA